MQHYDIMTEQDQHESFREYVHFSYDFTGSSKDFESIKDIHDDYLTFQKDNGVLEIYVWGIGKFSKHFKTLMLPQHVVPSAKRINDKVVRGYKGIKFKPMN